MPPSPLPFQLTLRSQTPDFLDLPWQLPLEDWAGHCPRLVEVQRGLSRHTVVFVAYGDAVFALKALPLPIAEREYSLLGWLETQKLPSVHAAGLARPAGGPHDDRQAVLITRHLEFSLPYRHLFKQRGILEQQESLLDALVSLLVQLHLRRFFWGDCSLSNVLFRRDAGRLQAYLVDAETAELRETLSDGMRAFDLEIAQQNLVGDLLDLIAEGTLPQALDPIHLGEALQERYQRLWRELNDVELIPPDGTFRIESRVRRLNELGFSVGELILEPTDHGDRLQLKVMVADRQYHREQLMSLVGLSAGESQARELLNDMHRFNAVISSRHSRSLPLSVIAYRWLQELYLPTQAILEGAVSIAIDPIEAYCDVLVHKWYLSERAGSDVGLGAAALAYVTHLIQERGKAPAEAVDASKPGGEAAVTEVKESSGAGNTQAAQEK